MGYLIGDFQNAFLPGKQISDNILLAHEAMNKVNSHKKGKSGRFAFKADMRKAYDRVNWDFLKVVLLKVGLPPRLVALIMNCVTTVSYQDKDESVKEFHKLLVDYCDAPGQIINEEKYGIIFSPSTKIRNARTCMKILKIKGNKGMGKYMGLPTEVQGCKSGKTIHWCSHKFLSLPKCEGGLGIRNIECLNRAMLAKHGYRIASGHDSYFSRVFRKLLLGKAMLGDERSIRKHSGLSWGSRSILHVLILIQEHMGWKPGCASTLNVWTGKWVEGEYGEAGNVNLKVRDLFIEGEAEDGGSWNEDIVRGFFSEETASKILAMPVNMSRREDSIFWPHSSTGEYNVKSGYGIVFTNFMELHGSEKDKSRVGWEEKAFAEVNYGNYRDRRRGNYCFGGSLQIRSRWESILKKEQSWLRQVVNYVIMKGW
ncbi:uncharacterized protein LOC141630321 [Silene latifolia]|uniref:uncharacterized protein LOC141630321 n=1 Tax=Silene latifolia TaxID=37657 RepID=UPI003D76D59E